MRQVDADLEKLLSGYADLVRTMGHRPDLKYATIEEAVLKEGLVFAHEPYTPEEEAVLLDVFRGARAWLPKRCFFNAQATALQDERLGYAEGYVLAHRLPLAIEHAWNFIPESGKPVDVTLRETGEPPTCDPAELLARTSRNLEHGYRGVIIPIDAVRRHWTKTGQSDSLIGQPKMRRDIQRRGFPASWQGVDVE